MVTSRNWTSASWYRVQAYRPRLRSHARIHRHVYRGQVWYVLQDRASGRFHRFTPETHRIIAMMDGQRSLDEIWETASTQLDIDAVTQDELVQVVGQLYSADVLAGDVPSDIVEQSERGRRSSRQQLLRSMMNPLALRVPIVDPDDFLTATLPLVRPLFSVGGWAVFFGLVAYALILAAINWEPLTANVVDRVLTRENLILLFVAYPMVKVLHELGHAYAIKRWGGAVNEIGVMFLVFMPVPYVNASDSIAFASKWQRMMVGGAGIIVEIFCASVAMVVWAGAEEGLVRAFAFNIMLIGGVSTLLFNGNPLLRFDGYYVLCDLIEIPNLAQRSNTYLAYLVQRHGFGMSWVNSPANARGEAVWFFFYGIAAYAYRLVVTAAIIALVATRFFVVGLLLAVWSAFLMVVLPVLKGIRYLFAAPALRRNRGRAFAVVGGISAVVLAGLFAMPLPYNTVAEGIVTPPPQAYANAGSDGEIVALYVTQGQRLRAGDPIIRIDDPLILARRKVLAARVNEVARQLAAEDLGEQTGLRILQDEYDAAVADLALTDERIVEQTVLAPADGIVILPVSTDLVGRYVRRGDLVAVVADFVDPLVRVVVPEDRADLVRSRTLALDVRFASDPATSHAAHVARAASALSRSLPSLALATEGGGRIALDPGQPVERLQAIEGFYQMDLALEGKVPVAVYGDRVFVRFAHGQTPVAGRLYRAVSQVFLKYFKAKDRA